MKKLKYLLLLVFIIPFVASALTLEECRKNASLFTTINGTYDITYCYRAACSSYSNGTWNYVNIGRGNAIKTSNKPYSCSNGNTNPYTKWISNGCAAFSGSCNVTPAKYCNMVQHVDCNLKKDGSVYQGGGNNNPGGGGNGGGNGGGGTTTNNNGGGGGGSKSSKKTTTLTTKTPGGSRVIITTTDKPDNTDSTRPTVETTTTEPPKSGNTNITKILLNGVDLKYHNEYNEYTVKVKKGVRELEVMVETEDPKTFTHIEGAYDMPDEDSEITIIVEAENGDTKTVIINVRRYEGESSDCNIANIAMTGYEINHFDKTNYDYQLGIKGKTKSINFEIIPSDPLHAEYEIIGNENLQNNSVITINVKAEDGTMCYYNIKVKKMSGFWKVVFIIVIITIVLLLAVYFIYRYLKRSKNQYEYE